MTTGRWTRHTLLAVVVDGTLCSQLRIDVNTVRNVRYGATPIETANILDLTRNDAGVQVATTYDVGPHHYRSLGHPDRDHPACAIEALRRLVAPCAATLASLAVRRLNDQPSRTKPSGSKVRGCERPTVLSLPSRFNSFCPHCVMQARIIAARNDEATTRSAA